MRSSFKAKLAASTLCLAFAGCASMQAIPSKMKSLVSRTPDVNDPLGDDTVKVSSAFKTAKKELKAADKTLLSLAKWSEERNDLEEAQRRYRDLVADNPDNIDARIGVARVEFKSGRKQEAENILKATVKKFPDSTEAWIETGNLYSQMEQWDKAASSYAKAVKIDGEDRTAQYQLGIALAHSDQLDEAVTHLTKAGGESAALYNIGYILHQAGRDSEAVSWFRRSMASQPDEQTRRSAGQMLVSLGVEGGSSEPLIRPSTQLVSASREKSVVNVEQTSFQSYRETPGISTTTSAMTEEDLIDTTGRSFVEFPKQTTPMQGSSVNGYPSTVATPPGHTAVASPQYPPQFPQAYAQQPAFASLAGPLPTQPQQPSMPPVSPPQWQPSGR